MSGFPQFYYSVSLGGLEPSIFKGILAIGLFGIIFLFTIFVTEIPVFFSIFVKNTIITIQTTIDGRDCIMGISSAIKDTIDGANLLQLIIPIPFFQKYTVIKVQNNGPTKSPTSGIRVDKSATKANRIKNILSLVPKSPFLLPLSSMYLFYPISLRKCC